MVQRVVHQAQGWRQLLDGAEFAVDHSKRGVLELDVMLERGGCQQFDRQVIGDHVREVQTQLSVAA
ncbi:hypothetical protein D3C75_1245660 [compost metagenome]